MTNLISTTNAEHYLWGDGCDGWHLLKDAKLSVIRERVPAGKGEVMHSHAVAQQFFFILSGQDGMEIDDGVVHLGPGEGLHVAAGAKHRFFNAGDEEVEFLTNSSPTTRGDRVDADS